MEAATAMATKTGDHRKRMLLMSVSARGLLGAAWRVARALSLVALAFVVIRWSAITESPRRQDGTPQLSFMFFVVLPLVTFVLLGFLSDAWRLWRRKSEGQRSKVRVAFALAGAALLAVTSRCFALLFWLAP